MKLDKRIKWIDSSKAIAIVLVIVGHMIGDLENPINRFILSFHMPFFFFISGYLSNAEKDVNVYLVNKLNTIFLPQVFLIAWSWLVNGITGRASWTIDPISLLSGVVSLDSAVCFAYMVTGIQVV